MDKVKREYAYRTTDGKLFSGKSASKCSKEHQKRIDFRNTVKEIMPEMGEIFKLEDVHDEIHEDDLINKMNDELLYECDDFDDLIERFVDIYLKIPEIVKCFQLIDRRFKSHK